MDRIKEKLSAVGDAIRQKTGKSELLNLDEMPAEIAAIETGIKTDDATAVAGDILSGKTAYVKGNKITGNIPSKTSSDLSASEATVTVPSGYYASQATKSVATATQATPSISVDSAGKITALATQTAGYVAAGTKSATKQLTVQGAQTITPSTSNQTIAAGTYLSGAQTIAGDADLKAANIKKGVNIFGVNGSYDGISDILNFEAVGGTSAPSNPKENMIWVNTNQAITSWDFSATEPNRRSSNKNLICYPFYYTGRTINGITFTDNKNGSIGINGTATAQCNFYLSLYGENNNEMLLDAGTYTMGDDLGNLDANLCIIIHYSYDNWATTEPQVSCGGRSATFTLTKPARARAQIWVRSGTVISSKNVRPQLEKGSVATSFVKGDATGQVWFTTGTTSPAGFNALKKNAVQVYPIVAKQYVNGAWVKKTAKSYQGGKWADWYLEKWIIQAGAKKTDIQLTNYTMTSNSGYIRFRAEYGYHKAYIKADLTHHNTMTIQCTISNGTDGFLCVWPLSLSGTLADGNTKAYQNAIAKQQLGTGTVTLDISSLSGEYYVGFTGTYNYTYDIYDWYLHK